MRAGVHTGQRRLQPQASRWLVPSVPRCSPPTPSPPRPPAPPPLQEAPGFTSEPEDSGAAPKTVLTGFARNAVLGVAGEVIKAVEQGKLKHIFLIGECRWVGWGWWGLV